MRLEKEQKRGKVSLVGKREREKKNEEVVTKKKKLKGLIQWEYGVGEEGIKMPPGIQKPIKAVIVDRCFPWWYSPARSVEFNVTNIWLMDYIAIDRLSIVQEWCGESEIDVGKFPSERFVKAVLQCDIVLCGESVPESLIDKGLWDSNVTGVISTRGSRTQSKEPWMTSPVTITHAAVGGVTDGKFTLRCHLKGASININELLSNRTYVRQDMRCILKSKEDGKATQAPVEAPPMDAVGVVRFCGNKVIAEAGLYPLGRSGIQVVTRFRHNQWVIRELSLLERLLAYDIPEHLIRCLENKDCEWLLSSVHTPIKVLQHLVEIWSEICRSDGYISLGSRLACGAKRVGEITRERICRMEIDGVTSSLVTVDRTSNEETSTIEEVPEVRNSVATKHDDAKVQTYLWDERVKEGIHPMITKRELEKALRIMRKYLLRSWKIRIWRSYITWETTEEKSGRTVDEETKDDAWDCLTRCFRSTWWAWDNGSRPLFWRWPKDYQISVQYGVPVWFRSTVKKWTCKQKGSSNIRTNELIREKLTNIRTKGYVESGNIFSLMSYFNVPKGKDDIRMVYDGTKSGLNDSLWAPWFPLPTVEGLIRSLEPGFSMADNDVGEMFHNFVLHKDLRTCCGLDVTPYFGDGKKVIWERWTRLAMGLRNSPYNAVQGMMIAKEVILGDRLDQRNIFRWQEVMVNLPGALGYDPGKSWIRKVRDTGVTAADLFIYVDDIRTSAPTQNEAWTAAQRTSSILGSLGLQDASRKRREPGQETGAWTGSVVWTSNNKLVVLTTQDKWDKTKSHLLWIRENMNNPQGIDSKQLQSIRGFLVYIARTYTSFVPYLKGIHATIDSWRPGRSGDGWKYQESKPSILTDAEEMWADSKLGMDQINTKEPKYVFPVPRLADDIHCLIELTESTLPPHRKVRMNKDGRVIYGFGDASKQGFGVSVETSDKSISWRSGKFVSIIQEQSSNFRELLNLVEYIEEAFNEGLLDNCELFMFTDNATAEAAYFKGSSKSESLFKLVLRLRKIEMSGKCIIHMIHIAGTRMIWQGTDGLSRGDRNAGVMAGQSMLSFVPLHLSAGQRSSTLIKWCTSWGAPGDNNNLPMKILDIKDWYLAMVDTAVYVWIPPPAIADVAGELMAQAIHKRPTSTHIFICPRLMTARWMRLVLKATDVLWTIPLGSEIWDVTNHEPLLLAISFPLSRDRPWKHRGTSYMEHQSKLVQAMFKSDCRGAGAMLCKLIVRARLLASM